MIPQLEIESYGISDIGLARGNNEDVWIEMPSYHFYALADGMGGHQAGEVAAKETILALCDVVDSFFSKGHILTVDDAKEVLKAAISAANSWVRQLGKTYPNLAGMGTTLCSLLIFKSTLIYTHLGDSRIYKFRDTLERLTQDHSTKQRVVSNKNLDETGKPVVKYKTMITKAIGITDTVSPEIHTLPIQIGDLFLLCSDGLTDCVKDSAIEKVLKENVSLKNAAIELVSQAKLGGGNDNITLVIIRAS